LQAVEEEVHLRMSTLGLRVKSSTPEISTKQYVLWLLGAFVLTVITLYVGGAIPFKFDDSLPSNEAPFPIREL
jgi:hypothetical protein